MVNRESRELPRIGGGRYRILEAIGEGGSGAVFRAYDAVLREDVALKVLLPGPGAAPSPDSGRDSRSAGRRSSAAPGGARPDPAGARKAVPDAKPAPGPGAGGLIGVIDEEFRVLSGLSHPNLAEVYDYGITPDGARYFTRELPKGEALKSFSRRRRSAAADDPEGLAWDPGFREVLAGVLAALDYIHTRGVIHEDLKPSNVMVLPARPPRGPGDP